MRIVLIAVVFLAGCALPEPESATVRVKTGNGLCVFSPGAEDVATYPLPDFRFEADLTTFPPAQRLSFEVYGGNAVVVRPDGVIEIEDRDGRLVCWSKPKESRHPSRPPRLWWRRLP